MSSFPGTVPVFNNPSGTDYTNSVTVPHHEQHSNANDEIEAICTELGTDPAGAAATVAARITATETVANAAQPAVTAEVLANKDSTVTLGTSDVKYPTQKAVKTYADQAGLWETDGGDAELKTADDLDMQNMQIKGMCIENRTNDTGCTQTGRIWFRTDV